jgi:hypothetical protein
VPVEDFGLLSLAAKRIFSGVQFLQAATPRKTLK